MRLGNHVSNLEVSPVGVDLIGYMVSMILAQRLWNTNFGILLRFWFPWFWQTFTIRIFVWFPRFCSIEFGFAWVHAWFNNKFTEQRKKFFFDNILCWSDVFFYSWKVKLDLRICLHYHSSTLAVGFGEGVIYHGIYIKLIAVLWGV